MGRPRIHRALEALAAAYFAAATVGVIAEYGEDSLASSPAHVADGEVWRLLTSGLVVEGDLPLLQVAIAAAAAFAVIPAFGPVAWWGAVLAAHLGSALVTYAVIGLFDVLGT